MGSFTDPDLSDIHTLAWQVLDGSGNVLAVGSGATFTFTPADDGVYTVSVTVTDDADKMANAFIGAADKLARALDTDLGRVKDRNGRETIRAAVAE